ncbi:MAG TPA: hypothetical protein VKB80_27955 [Kofleriaceae bacterium]|nr:hypothetical protein [Kofleriaceae bacterium]
MRRTPAGSVAAAAAGIGRREREVVDQLELAVDGAGVTTSDCSGPVAGGPRP